MKTLRCVVCGKVTEAHDYADAVICDDCPVPVLEPKEETNESAQ